MRIDRVRRSADDAERDDKGAYGDDQNPEAFHPISSRLAVQLARSATAWLRCWAART
jgi:hypothetical protein